MTTETGDYSFTLLPVGNYEIKTELTGFKTQAAKIALATGDRARVDVKLELGAVSETLTVSGEAPLLQTDTSRVVDETDERDGPECAGSGAQHRQHAAVDAGSERGPGERDDQRQPS